MRVKHMTNSFWIRWKFTYLHGKTRMMSVILYGSMHIAQQSLSMSLLSSDLMLFVGIFDITRLATVHSCRWNWRTQIVKCLTKLIRLDGGWMFVPIDRMSVWEQIFRTRIESMNDFIPSIDLIKSKPDITATQREHSLTMFPYPLVQ